MSEDRPANDPAVELGQLRRDYEDLKSTLLAQAGRRPVGDIEATIRSTPKANTVFAQGQTVTRADYPVLWQWVQDQGLVAAGVFGAGDGATTFVLPDWRGRTPIGAGTGAGGTYAVGGTGGAATINLTTAQLAAHSHTINQEGSGGRHTHDVIAEAGGHGGINNQAISVSGGVSGNTVVLFAAITNVGVNHHTHGETSGQNAFHTHTSNNTGSGAAVDVRQPYVGVNWLIWT